MTADSWINKRGVLSFSSVRDDILMWSHYGESTQESASDSTQAIIFQLRARGDYAEDYPEINMLNVASLLVSGDRESGPLAVRLLIRALFLIKAGHWRYESEWRLIRVTPGVERTSSSCRPFAAE